MKIIFAQLKKDVVSARGLFWWWFACTAAQILLGLSRFVLQPGSSAATPPSGALLFSMMGVMTAAVALQIAQFILTLALMVRVVHTDSLVDANAFWRTRPIPRAELLGAKALAIALLALGLTLSWLATGMYGGAGADGGGGGMLGAWLRFGVFIMGLFALAAVTPNLTRLILTALGYSVGTQLLAQFIWRMINHGSAAPLSVRLGTTSLFHGWIELSLASAVGLGGFAAAAVWQYLTLRTDVARVIIGATFLASALLKIR